MYKIALGVIIGLVFGVQGKPLEDETEAFPILNSIRRIPHLSSQSLRESSSYNSLLDHSTKDTQLSFKSTGWDRLAKSTYRFQSVVSSTSSGDGSKKTDVFNKYKLRPTLPPNLKISNSNWAHSNSDFSLSPSQPRECEYGMIFSSLRYKCVPKTEEERKHPIAK